VQQLDDLKIKINKEKLDSAVSEIVETDFFNDLQAKAQELRRNRQNTTDTDAKTDQS